MTLRDKISQTSCMIYILQNDNLIILPKSQHFQPLFVEGCPQFFVAFQSFPKKEQMSIRVFSHLLYRLTIIRKLLNPSKPNKNISK